MTDALTKLAGRYGATVHHYPGGEVIGLRFAPAPPTLAPPTEAERSLADLRDAVNVSAETVECLTAFGLSGGDTLEHRAAAAGVALDLTGDACALYGAQAETSGSLRIGHRPLGEDFALPLSPPEVETVTARPPRGSVIGDAGSSVNLAEWYRDAAPDGGWRALGLIVAEGREVCFQCHRRVRGGRPLSVLEHPANELTIRACLPCAAGLQDRPTMRGETREERSASAYDDEVTYEGLKDARLWNFSRNRTFASRDLGEDFRINLLRKPSGSLELSINFPDMIDCAKVIGFYQRPDDALRAAVAEIDHWRKS